MTALPAIAEASSAWWSNTAAFMFYEQLGSHFLQQRLRMDSAESVTFLGCGWAHRISSDLIAAPTRRALVAA